VTCRRVGLTGGIACGKTTVTDYFQQLGVTVLDADVVSRELVQPSEPAWHEIRARFGEVILNQDGQLNRPRLRQQIFADNQARKDLEAILHPRIRERMLQRANALKENYCILSIPLLLETKQMDLVERILVIDCTPALQHQRLAQRDNLSAEQIKQILDAQVNRNERLRCADDILDNSLDKNTIYNKVTRLHQFYTHWACT
jgi:dephospho-CoA kinase